MLADLGLVTSRENYGSFVTKLTNREFEEAFDIASLLETYSAKLAAKRVSKEELSALKAINAKIEGLDQSKENYFENFRKLNNKFHEIVHRASGNDILFDLIQRVPQVANNVASARSIPLDLERVTFEHNRIIEALESGDADYSELQMQTHVETARRFMRHITLCDDY